LKPGSDDSIWTEKRGMEKIVLIDSYMKQKDGGCIMENERKNLFDEDREVIGKALVILATDTVYRDALKASIESFFNAIKSSKKFEENEERIKSLKDRLDKLENL
jgi:hypothetical protein